MASHSSSGDSGQFFEGPGEARAKCREVAWLDTPLGPVSSWSAGQRTAIRLCLDALSPMAVWLGKDLVLIHNDAYAAVLGAKAAWAMGRTLREVWSEVFDLAQPQFQRVVEHGESLRFEEVRFVLERTGRKQDAYFCYGLSPIRDEDGRVLGAINVLEETTRTVQARKDGERRYRALFDSVDEGFCIIEAILDDSGRGVDHRFIEANPAFERHTGLKGAIGRTARELVPDLEPRWPQTYGRIATTGTPERFVDHSAAMGRWFEVDAFRIGEPDERKVALLFRDITHRKAAEDAVLESQARLERERRRLQLILDTLPVGLCILDAAGDVVLSNEVDKRIWAGQAPLAGVQDQSRYKGCCPETGEPLTPDQWPAMQALRLGRKVEGQLVDIERLDGTRGTLVFSAAPLLGDGGRPEGAVVATQDVSELRQAKARLEEADRQKNHFLAVLSHELRNPLAPVKNSLFVLGRVPPGGDQARHALRVIESQVTQLTVLVNDLLDVTRITSGKVRLDRRAVELNELVARAVDDHLGLFDSSGVQVRFDRAAAAVIVDADRNRLAQVVGNLLQNAAKFTPAGGRVRVGVSSDPEVRQAQISVADNGLGVAPDMLERLFEPFVQAEDTLERNHGGLGVGLALVRGLVELHGGSVSATSQGLGHGAQFVVRLPLGGAEDGGSV